MVHLVDSRDWSETPRNPLDEATEWVTCARKEDATGGGQDIVICTGMNDIDP